MAAPKVRKAGRRQARWTAEERRARRIATSIAYNAVHRALVVATCITCTAPIPVHHGGPARKHCSPSCRGRAQRG